eukprot:TRINITY_DN3231_c0_g1_i3.p1 TRINITY_DN3231_c0_g1~~TRINITY_DN3231_c0_g1_i3.p1  ORF type:complete len:148 (-),score=31.21 TRINITY_DN3231_c0_g1_i3:45-488(-)
MLTRALRTSSMAGRQEILLTRAKKKTGGKKKTKAKIEPPEGFCVDMLAKDWANWPNGEHIDVSIPWTEDNEPEWVNRLYESQALPPLREPHELDVEKHGLRYTLSKIREQKIKEDNRMRAAKNFGEALSLQNTRRKKRKPFTNMNLT